MKDSMNAAVESSKWPTRKVASTATRKAMKLPYRERYSVMPEGKIS